MGWPIWRRWRSVRSLGRCRWRLLTLLLLAFLLYRCLASGNDEKLASVTWVCLFRLSMSGSGPAPNPAFVYCQWMLGRFRLLLLLLALLRETTLFGSRGLVALFGNCGNIGEAWLYREVCNNKISVRICRILCKDKTSFKENRNRS